MIYDKTRDRYSIYDKNRRAQIYDKSEDETITTQSIIKQETEKLPHDETEDVTIAARSFIKQAKKILSHDLFRSVNSNHHSSIVKRHHTNTEERYHMDVLTNPSSELSSMSDPEIVFLVQVTTRPRCLVEESFGCVLLQ